MKNSNLIGIATAIVIIITCFLPWVYIEAIDVTITGVSAKHTSYGWPGLFNIIFSSLSILFSIIPAIWAKRTNLFIATFNFAWTLRNFLILSKCEMGECPVKRFGLYALMILSVVLMIMTLVPDVKIADDKS